MIKKLALAVAGVSAMTAMSASAALIDFEVGANLDPIGSTYNTGGAATDVDFTGQGIFGESGQDGVLPFIGNPSGDQVMFIIEQGATGEGTATMSLFDGGAFFSGSFSFYYTAPPRTLGAFVEFSNGIDSKRFDLSSTANGINPGPFDDFNDWAFWGIDLDNDPGAPLFMADRVTFGGEVNTVAFDDISYNVSISDTPDPDTDPEPNPTPVPTPGTLLLLAAGMLGLRRWSLRG